MRRLVALAAIAVVAAVVVVAATTTGGTKQGASAAVTDKGAAVALGRSSLGSILVDSHGRSLYLFEADRPGMSDCSGSCASVWPPLTTAAAPRAAAGVTAGKLGTIVRGGGPRQVTYNGHPLYTYAGDARPGATAGQGLDQFGAEWYVLNATGDKIDTE